MPCDELCFVRCDVQEEVDKKRLRLKSTQFVALHFRLPNSLKAIARLYFFPSIVVTSAPLGQENAYGDPRVFSPLVYYLMLISGILGPAAALEDIR